MKPIFIGLLTLLFVTFLPAFAEERVKLEVFYPKNNEIINASSVFVVGNTDPKAELKINGREAKVYPNGAFVLVTPLEKGCNVINIKSVKGHAKKNLKYIVKVPENKNFSEKTNNSSVISPFTAEIIKDYAVIRTFPDKSRLTPLPQGTLLDIIEKIGDTFKFKYSDSLSGWISQKDIKCSSEKNWMSKNFVKLINIDSDSNNVYIKLPLVRKLPFLVEQTSENIINLKLYGAIAAIDMFSYNNTEDFIKEIKWVQESDECLNLGININPKQFWGYKYYYEGDTLVLKLRKPPVISPLSPLKDKIICLDAGHGGSEQGAMGPTGVPEKTINLAIAQKLKKILENNGAKVIMTRDSDKYVDLYNRVDIASTKNAQVLISIHNNSLPYGKDPYIEHGTSTYYYHSQSLPLAKILHKNLVNATEFNDLGIFYSSFVLTRPTEVPSVLLETGFMINPDEYSQLITSEFQEKAARGIAKGLEEFFLSQLEK